MNSEFQHLLSKHKILNSFNISKRIKKSYLSNLKSKLKKLGKSESEISEEINKKIVLSTQKFMDENEIPGIQIIHEGVELIPINEKTKNLMLYIANECLFECKKNKFTKEHIIIFMQLFLHLARVTNKDVFNFKKKYGIETPEDTDYDEDNEDDEI